MAADWLRLATSVLPTAPQRICEVNSKDGTAAGELLRRWPAASFVGLAFQDGDRAERRTALAAFVAAQGSRASIRIGDRLRTVRVAKALDDCDVMIVDTQEANSAAGKKVRQYTIAGDMPNILQRVATGSGRGNVLVMHGTDCEAARRGALTWCTTWDELVSRQLVSAVGCVKSAGGVGTPGERWCVGRVATDSACARRPPLLPTALASPSVTRPRAFQRGRGLAETADAFEGAAQHSPRPGWSSQEVGGLQLGYWWRYFTILPRCSREPTTTTTIAAAGAAAGAAARDTVCLVFKNHVFESWVGGVLSTDGGRTFEAEPSLVMPATWPTARMTHNLAIASASASDGDAVGGGGGGYLIVGGQYKLRGAARCGKRSGNVVPCRPNLPAYNGLWMARGQSWRFMKPSAAQIQIRAATSGEELAKRSEDAQAAGEAQWADARWLFNGTHAGCVERRSRYYASMAHLNTCEFDGRLSLVSFGGRLLLYARANPATHGQRYVQVSASDDGGCTWGAFAFVSIAEYSYAQGDVYFFAVSPNPAHPGSLLALFPLAHKFRGCIGLAASTDGLHWSAPTPLLRCAVHGERAVHHPAQGLVREGSRCAPTQPQGPLMPRACALFC